MILGYEPNIPNIPWTIHRDPYEGFALETGDAAYLWLPPYK